VTLLGISIFSKGFSYSFDGVDKHHLLGVISQVLMIVLFDASIKSGHNFEIFTMRRIAL
jgi:hypothetical protein